MFKKCGKKLITCIAALLVIAIFMPAYSFGADIEGEEGQDKSQTEIQTLDSSEEESILKIGGGTERSEQYSEIITKAINDAKVTDITSGKGARSIVGNIDKAKTAQPLYANYGVFKFKTSEKGNYKFTAKAPSSSKDVTLRAFKFMNGEAGESEYKLLTEASSVYSKGNTSAILNVSAEEGDYIYIIASFSESMSNQTYFKTNITVTATGNYSNEIVSAVASLESQNSILAKKNIDFEYESDSDSYIGRAVFSHADYAGRAEYEELKVSLSYYDASGTRVKIEANRQAGSSKARAVFNSRDDGNGLDYAFEAIIERTDGSTTDSGDGEAGSGDGEVNPDIAKIETANWKVISGSKVTAGSKLVFKKGEGTEENPYLARVKIPTGTFSSKTKAIQYSFITANDGNVIANGGNLGKENTVTVKKAKTRTSGKSKTEEFVVVSANGNNRSYYRILFIDSVYTDLSKATVKGCISLGYTGKPVVHDNINIAVGGVELKEGVDYQIIYRDNIDVSKSAKLVITGKGFYTGRLTKAFGIVKGQQTDLNSDLTYSSKSSVNPENLYVGKNTATITVGEQIIDLEGEEYVAENVGAITVTSSKSRVASVTKIDDRSYKITPKASGTVKITVKTAGNSNFNIATKTYSITVVKPSQIKSSMIGLSPTTALYDGRAQKPNVTVKLTRRSKPLVEGQDYTVSYINNVNVGTGKVLISAVAGNYMYSGTDVSKSFSIRKGKQTKITAKEEYSSRNQTDPDVLYVGKNSVTIIPDEEKIIANGDTPVAENVGTFTATSSRKSVATVTKMVDGSFKITPKSAGTVKISLKASGNANYNSLTKTYTYKVLRPVQITQSMVTLSRTTYVYDGQPKEPEVTVRISRKAQPLEEGKDYIVEYVNNINASATAGADKSYGEVRISASPDNYALGGTDITKTFTIGKASQRITVSFDKETMHLAEGYNTVKLTVEHTDLVDFTNVGDVIVEVSDEKIATAVDNEDGTWTITGLRSGKVGITVTAEGNSNVYSATETFDITINQYSPEETSRLQEQFITICKFTEMELKAYLEEQLKSTHDEIISGDGYLYAKGEVPVLLVAHMDTFLKTPTEIKYDSDTGELTSPTGIGGDDRCGVFIVLQMIKETNCSVLFLEQEEKHSIGAFKFVETELATQLKGTFNYIIEMDRKGRAEAVFYKCDNPEFKEFVTREYYHEDYGTWTDIRVLGPYLECAAVNLSTGCYRCHTKYEYVVWDHMVDNIYYATKLIKRTTVNDIFEYVEEEGASSMF